MQVSFFPHVMDKSLDDLLYQYFLLCQHFHAINVTLNLTEIPVHQLTLPHPLACGWSHDHLVRSHDSHMTCHTFLGGFLQLSEVEDEEVGDGPVLFVCHSDFLGRFFRLDLFFLFLPILRYPVYSGVLFAYSIYLAVYPVTHWLVQYITYK